MGNVHIPPNSRGSVGGCVARSASKKVTGGSTGGSGGGTPQPGTGPHLCDSTDEVDSLSSGSLKAATANDCGARYMRHEEWLADVCGVSRRRSVDDSIVYAVHDDICRQILHDGSFEWYLLVRTRTERKYLIVYLLFESID